MEIVYSIAILAASTYAVIKITSMVGEIFNRLNDNEKRLNSMQWRLDNLTKDDGKTTLKKLAHSKK